MNRSQSNEVPVLLGSPLGVGAGWEKSGNSQPAPLHLRVDSRSYLFFSRGGNLATLEAGTPLGNELCSFVNGKSQEVELGYWEGLG